ncbi:hypothetical protein HYW41_00935 [Candidatus Daviesbacteria bacterium]|nr:hypothetical protein [Candidatus Daviesbacteria bacterium]
MIFTALLIASLGVAQSLPILDTNVKDGYIISASQTGYVLSKAPYDPGIVGVVTDNPAMLIRVKNKEGVHPVSSSGIVSVYVSSDGGPIKKDDLITSSKKAGVGMKATETGFVLGTALEDCSSTPGVEGVGGSCGKIKVALNMRYAVSAKSAGKIGKSLKDAFSLSTIAALERPSDVFKYVFSGGLVLVSIALGVLIFGRSATLGVEALGRNPRASFKITMGIVMNVAITVAIIIGSLGVTYFILLS